MSSKKAICCALGSVLLYAAVTPILKLIVLYITPIMLAGLMHLGGGAALTVAFLFQKFLHNRSDLKFLPNRKDWVWVAGPTIFGGLLAPLLLTTAMSITSASCVSLLLNLEIIFTVIMAWLLDFGKSLKAFSFA